MEVTTSTATTYTAEEAQAIMAKSIMDLSEEELSYVRSVWAAKDEAKAKAEQARQAAIAHIVAEQSRQEQVDQVVGNYAAIVDVMAYNAKALGYAGFTIHYDGTRYFKPEVELIKQGRTGSTSTRAPRTSTSDLPKLPKGDTDMRLKDTIWQYGDDQDKAGYESVNTDRMMVEHPEWYKGRKAINGSARSYPKKIRENVLRQMLADGKLEASQILYK